MKTTTPLLVLFDLWCLLAIAQLPLIYNMGGFLSQSNLIILAITVCLRFVSDNQA